MSKTLIRAKTHYPYTISGALLTVPLWAALWIAYKYHGDINLWRPWLLLTARDALSPEEWKASIQAGFVGALMTGAGLFWLCDGMVFGTTGTHSHGDARWARRREIKKANLINAWGIVLGKFGKPTQHAGFMRAQSDDHGTVLISGPPRSGKGVGIIVPTILEYRGSPICYDVKGELYETTARARVQKGDRVLLLSPFDVSFPQNPAASLVGRSHSFNPLLEIAAMRDLEDRLVEIGKISSALLAPKSYGGAEASLMEDADMIFKAAMAIVCNEPEPSLGRVLQALTPKIPKSEQAADYKTMFATLAERAPEPVSQAALLRFSGQDNKQLGIYMSILLGGGLKAWENPAIVRATQKNDFDFSKLRWEPHSIYIVIPEAYKQEAKPLVRLFFQHAINVTRRSLIGPHQHFLPILFMIDEFHSLGKMPGVLDAVTTLPGYGGRLCLVVQSPASLREHYGASGEEIFMESAHLHVWLTPNNDETKAKLSRTLGNQTISQKSISGKAWSSKTSDGRSESWSEKARALMTPEEVGRMDKEEIIITGKGLYPIKAHRVTYFKDRYFKKLYAGQNNTGWPEIPLVKEGETTSFGEFLRAADVSGTAIEKEAPEPDSSGAKEQEKTEIASTPPASENTSIFAHFAEDDGEAPITGSPQSLAAAMESIKAPELTEWVGTLLTAAPVTEKSDGALMQATKRLSPDELFKRLAPLFISDTSPLTRKRIQPT